MKKVYAFDVFDTCLVRKVAVPSAIFREVAVRLSLKLDATSASFVDDFVAARIDAEEVVRRQSKREEITLFEIWAQIKIVMGWSGHESLEQLELDVEDEVLVAVAAVCKKVQVARQNSGRIVFISDIYLPAKFVERQLRKHGIAQPGDGFYISSEVGMTKASGNLFRHVLDAEGVQASQMLHVGDNLHSDYSIPKGLGIVVDAFSDTCLSPGEVSLMRLNTIPAASAKVAGAMRAFRLTNDQANLARVELVSQFLAPFTMGFATWVLRQAQKDGIKRLYFLSRDCQLTWKAACELSPHFGLIDCRYLYVSRQSLLLPSTTDISPEGMSWIKSRWETKVLLKSLLAKIELTFDEVEMNFCMLAGEARGDFCVSSENDWCEFWAALNEPELRIRIQALIAKRRDSTLTYFKSAGLFDNISWAIVDLGWYLNGQSALWQILKSQGWEGRIAGYYLALKCHRRPPSSAGEATAMIHESPDDFSSIAAPVAIFNYQTLLEHVIGCSDHPSVHHYGSGVHGETEIVYASLGCEKSTEVALEFHQLTLDFVRQNVDLARNSYCDENVSMILEALTKELFTHPSASVAASLCHMCVATDQNDFDIAPIVEPWTISEALLLLLPYHRLFPRRWGRRSRVWSEGSRARTKPWIMRLADVARRCAEIRSKVCRTCLR